jgi:hypothetical protein
MIPVRNWFELPAAVTMAARHFPDALGAVLGVTGRALGRGEVIAAIRSLCEAGTARLLPVGLPFAALKEHLEAMRDEGAAWQRRRRPDPKAQERARAEAEERARAAAEEARRRQEAAAAMDRAEERARAERMAAERRRVMNFFTAETARPKPG